MCLLLACFLGFVFSLSFASFIPFLFCLALSTFWLELGADDDGIPFFFLLLF
jgi:hypothetical protein